jgi:hypothetical protein
MGFRFGGSMKKARATRGGGSAEADNRNKGMFQMKNKQPHADQNKKDRKRFLSLQGRTLGLFWRYILWVQICTYPWGDQRPECSYYLLPLLYDP